MPKGLLSQLIDAFTCLPGVGEKTAQRFVYYLLDRNREGAQQLCQTLQASLERIGYCRQCRMFSEEELCGVCRSHKRDPSLLCVVETPASLMAIHSNTSFSGMYFVLHGSLSPLDGIGPDEIGLELLRQRLSSPPVKELILAIASTVEGDVTAHVIHQLAAEHQVKVTRIAQGVPAGGHLEFIDSTTLARAFLARQEC